MELTPDQVLAKLQPWFPGEGGRVLYELTREGFRLRADLAGGDGGDLVGVAFAPLGTVTVTAALDWLVSNTSAPVTSVNGQTGDVVLAAADIGAEAAFSKGDLIAGDGVTLTGTLTGRLVGSGNVTITATGGGTWGSITGTLADQADLQAALDAKADTAHAHVSTDVGDSTAAGRALLTAASAAAQRSALGLGTAAVANIGTSGAAVPQLNAANMWSGPQTFSTITYGGITQAVVQQGTSTGQLAVWNHATARWEPGSVSGGGIEWSIVSVDTTMATGTAYLVDCSGGTRNMTLPATITATDWFIVAAWGGSARVVRNGHTIEDIGAGNDLLVEAGETAYLVARNSSQLRIV